MKLQHRLPGVIPIGTGHGASLPAERSQSLDKTVYQQLLKDDERALEAYLLAHESRGEARWSATLDMPMAEEAKYVAVVGLFRHPDTVKNTLEVDAES